MATLTRPAGWPYLPAVFDLIDTAWPFAGRHPVHIEEVAEENETLIRAELPGMDPDDIHVTTSDGHLVIAAERRETTNKDKRSEFRYGSFCREIALPRSANLDGVTAAYRHGVLEVRVPLTAENDRKPVEIKIDTSA